MNGAGGFGERLRARFAEATVVVAEPRGEMLVEVPATAWRETCAASSPTPGSSGIRSARTSR